MDTQELIKELESIREDAYWSSGCSHEDALKDSLEDIEKHLAELIEKLTTN